MSDLGLIKNLDGFPASFQRLEGAAAPDGPFELLAARCE
jgi:hypothetical protein